MKIGRALATLVCLMVAPAGAENYTHVSGVIEDDSSALAPGATVTVVDEETGFRRVTQSGPDGSYIVSALQPGIYKITVRKLGFRTVIRFGVKLIASRPARVDFKLVVGSVQETITVQGTDPPFNSEDASVGALVGRDEIERLPANGSGLLTLLELAPGVVVTPATRGEAGQFTVSGQRPNMNYFTVDGVSANSGVGGGGLPAQSNGGALPGMTAFGSLDSLIARDALLEMRAQTSTTVPKFGRLPGGQISLSSRSGSNEWHGSLSFGLRNEGLDANDWLANRNGDPRAPLRMQDSGAAIGGPMWRDRTFVFASYEGMRLSGPFVWSQPSPSAAARADGPGWVQPALNLFPVPNGSTFGNGLAEWTGGFSRPSRLDDGSIRLDQAITSRLTAFARYSDSASAAQFGSDPVNYLNLRSRSLTAGLNLRARPDLVFDLRVNSSNAAEDSLWRPVGSSGPDDCYLESVVAHFFVPAPSCEYLRLSIAGVGQIVTGSEGNRSQSQFQMTHTASWTRGSHALQFGADYVRLSPFRRDATGSLSIITNSLADLTGANVLWTAVSPAQRTTARVEELSLFAEDTWRVAPRLTVTYGLRWEITPAPSQSGSANFLDVVTGSPTPLDRPIWQSRYDNFAPRIGLAYRLTNRGRTVIRAGAGFYLDSSLSLATDLINNGPLSFSQFVSPIHAIFSTVLLFGFVPDLRLPLVKQWNLSVEHAIGDHDIVSIGYVGSSGRNLIRREVGPGSVETEWLALATNEGASDYHSLQAHYRRRLARGFEAQASYAWSHSIDNSSTDAGIYWAGSGLTAGGDRASSDFDVRQTLTAGFTYETPAGARSRAWRGWALDGMFHARTGFPITVLDAEQFTGISFENVFRPNLAFGQPNWIADPSAPGGRRINSLAFTQAAGSAQGNLGRNALTGFGMTQLDLAVRREFSFSERRSLQLRIEAYNALNHANFADPVRFLASPLFGQSSSMLNLMLGTGSPGSGLAPMFQSGGPRTLQIGLRFRF